MAEAMTLDDYRAALAKREAMCSRFRGVATTADAMITLSSAGPAPLMDDPNAKGEPGITPHHLPAGLQRLDLGDRLPLRDGTDAGGWRHAGRRATDRPPRRRLAHDGDRALAAGDGGAGGGVTRAAGWFRLRPASGGPVRNDDRREGGAADGATRDRTIGCTPT